MRYFINGKEISEKEAKKIEKDNKKYMDSGDFELMMKCQFIVKIK